MRNEFLFSCVIILPLTPMEPFMFNLKYIDSICYNINASPVIENCQEIIWNESKNFQDAMLLFGRVEKNKHVYGKSVVA